MFYVYILESLNNPRLAGEDCSVAAVPREASAERGRFPHPIVSYKVPDTISDTISSKTKPFMENG
ncbi:MAG: hypothetical protein UY67_C0001G0064 [Candidatus Kaiserbacteria bacterium GW2011_GWA2_52_12]|uniref:Uncharacterized protein n=1 Tax=Candidatus Kaiserbacteria bacterium GW2011_GWA2_52_12 TaxID=1618671 RepID=A0A0G1ZBE2_9BACT|nr:MAG: hypothetical protein UY67_C0001G0064 [Candidatus Kaiserbacteria bacterium GW2011_GWA2_52_12]